MRPIQDSDFNAESREVLFKLDIFFDSTPMTILPEDYLIDSEWLEETGADTTNPLGAISSNELSFSLYNPNGIFSPTNTSSSLYGKIKTGVKVVPSIKLADTDWLKLGEYFVTQWQATVTGTSVNVVANDVVSDVLSKPTPNIPVETLVTFKYFLTKVFSKMGFAVFFPKDLTEEILYSYINGKPSEFLQEILQGAFAYCTTDKAGRIVIDSLSGVRPLRATLTDQDQIIDIKATQSVVKKFDGVELVYSLPQIVADKLLIDISSIQIPVGLYVLSQLSFNDGPMWQVESISSINLSEPVDVVSYEASPWHMSLSLNNTGLATTSKIQVRGSVISSVNTIVADNGTNLLKVSNKYIQSSSYADRYKRKLKSFVEVDNPTVEIDVRGNCLFNVGDKITVRSDKYNFNYTGVIQRMKYTYAGYLRCTITMLHAGMLEVI